MLYKEFVFVRLPKENFDKAGLPTFQIQPLRSALMKYTWSIHDKNWAVKEEFLNFDNMSIFNKGVILREIKAGELWEAEIAQTTPLPNSLVVSNTVFLQEKNSLNYSFQRDLFYSQPEAFIQSIGYKITKKDTIRGCEYFCNKMKGIEVFLFHRQGYIQISETFPREIEPEKRISFARTLLVNLQPYLSTEQVIISSSTFFPVDFVIINEDQMMFFK